MESIAGRTSGSSGWCHWNEVRRAQIETLPESSCPVAGRRPALKADAILVETREQLLSRALNRGYSMSRYRRPVDLGFLNNDCLWVMDEVQLMGAGLPTTSQLHAFRSRFETHGPVSSLWMSATLQQCGFATVDDGRFARERREGQSAPVNLRCYGFRLVFDGPQTGPLALGYACHFGLGQFVARPR